MESRRTLGFVLSLLAQQLAQRIDQIGGAACRQRAESALAAV
jgi:hypothetical protein